jgi:hydroxymethylglutaryl-CoA lyase
LYPGYPSGKFAGGDGDDGRPAGGLHRANVFNAATRPRNAGMTDRRVVINEVGPRDGLQIQQTFLATDDKVRLIDSLSAAGLPKIEATGFAHPDVVPQLRDAEKVLSAIRRRPGTRYAAYVPNVRGAERALAAGVDDIKAGLAASETFNELNVRMTVEQGVEAFRRIAALLPGTRARLAGTIATAFGCPYEGAVPVERVLRLIGPMVEGGAEVIHFADTTGMANPATIVRLVEAARMRWPQVRFGLHLHNTRGAGIANALAGLNAGIREFESSIGGLGGCPYAPRAVGNICTEDFVHMLHEMGYETGVDLDALLQSARLAEEMLGCTLPGMVMKAGKASQLHDPERLRNQGRATADATR